MNNIITILLNLEVAIGGLDNFDQKNCQITGWIQVDTVRIRSGFESNIVVSGHFRSDFGFL
jgi:hypothetical protein